MKRQARTIVWLCVPLGLYLLLYLAGRRFMGVEFGRRICLRPTGAIEVEYVPSLVTKRAGRTISDHQAGWLLELFRPLLAGERRLRESSAAPTPAERHVVEEFAQRKGLVVSPPE